MTGVRNQVPDTSTCCESFMSHLFRWATLRLTSEKWDVQWGQWCSFLVSPLMLVLAMQAVSRFATTTGEMVMGFLAAATVSLLFVMMGLVLRLAYRRSPPSI